MQRKLFRLGVRSLPALAALYCCSGCAIFVQNRYAVFRFDGLQTQSPEQARALSLAMLGGVALGGAGIGAVATWLVGTRRSRKAESQEQAPPQPDHLHVERCEEAVNR